MDIYLATIVIAQRIKLISCFSPFGFSFLCSMEKYIHKKDAFPCSRFSLSNQEKDALLYV